MASSKIKNPISGSGSAGPGGDISRGLPGITATDATTVQLLVQTAQDVVQNLTNFNSGVTSLSAAQQQQANAVQQNTLAVEQNTQGRSGGAAKAIESAASSLLGGAGLLSPLLSGIMSLFGGSSSQRESIPQPFSLPAPISVLATVNSSVANSAVQSTVNSPAAPSPAPVAAPTAVVVQVNAMDSRSFLDHKDEIAQAVREAVLHSHALNEVISQL